MHIVLRLCQHYLETTLFNNPAAMKTPTFPKIYNVYFLAMIATVGGMLYVVLYIVQTAYRSNFRLQLRLRYQ